MDKRLELISKILPHIDGFMDQQSDGSFHDFLAYLSEQKVQPEGVTKKTEAIQDDSSSATSLMQAYQDHGASLAFHLNRLGKYAKYYVKEGFKETALLNADDLGFLASVMEHESISKTALIAYNVHEVPSGMEVIRRLVRKGLLQERVNKDDRRVKMISATEAGKMAFFQAIQCMRPIGRLICGKLSEEELQVLNELLARLDHFHEDIYRSQKAYDLEQILAKHL